MGHIFRTCGELWIQILKTKIACPRPKLGLVPANGIGLSNGCAVQQTLVSSGCAIITIKIWTKLLIISDFSKEKHIKMVKN